MIENKLCDGPRATGALADGERGPRSMIPEGKRHPRAVLIAGPTASGKSALAVAIAAATGGLVVNADSMQIYRELRILTARPSPEEEAQAPHRLYGHVPAATSRSVGDWLDEAAAVLAEAEAAGRPAIFVGGTGLYFEALTRGLAEVPAIPPAVRAHWRERAARDGAEALHAELARRDGEGAARLRPSDTQRVTRALEVIEATGRSLAAWHDDPSPALLPPERAIRIVVEPERAELHRRIAIRFRAMVEVGAVEEAAAFAALGLSSDLPATRAIGVAALADAAAGRIGLDAAIERAIAETRQYAKRQSTWMRGRMADWRRFDPIAESDAAVAMAVAALGRA
jgi:tRNA dimethylallyltransferase